MWWSALQNGVAIAVWTRVREEQVFSRTAFLSAKFKSDLWHGTRVCEETSYAHFAGRSEQKQHRTYKDKWGHIHPMNARVRRHTRAHRY